MVQTGTYKYEEHFPYEFIFFNQLRMFDIFRRKFLPHRTDCIRNMKNYGCSYEEFIAELRFYPSNYGGDVYKN